MPTSNDQLNEKRPINVVVWFVVALVLGTTRIIRLSSIYPMGMAWFVAVTGDVVRALAVGALGVLLECTLRTTPGRSPTALRSLWGVALVSGLLVALDGVVDALLGYHLTTGLGIVFSGGATGLSSAVEAVGVSPRSLVEGLLVVAVVGLALWSVFRASERLSARLNIVISSRLAFWATVGLSAATVANLLLGPAVKSPQQWHDERRTLTFDMYPPPVDPSLVSMRVATSIAPAVSITPLAPSTRPDLLLIIIETFRRDALTAEQTPNIDAFSRSPGARALTALTSGNVTHYAWFGLFTGNYPFHYDRVRERGTGHAPPIEALLRAGYEVRVFSSADLSYLQLARTVFGEPGPGFEIIPEGPQAQVTDRDREMVTQVLQRVDREPAGGHLYVVSFNSTHFDYSTPEAPSNTPQPEIPLKEGLKEPAELLRARYRGSVRYVDGLVGKLLDGLRSRGRLDDFKVVITGDHGESFGEHGVFAHGTDLSREQIEVPLILRLSPSPRTSNHALLDTRTRVAHVDIMPTLLEELGIRASVPTAALAGVPLQSTDAYGPRIVVQGWLRGSTRFAWVDDDDHKLILEFDAQSPFDAHRLKWMETVDRDDRPRSNQSVLRSVEELPRVLPWVRYE